MAGEAPSHNWLVSLVFDRAFGWILHTFELLYLLIQLGLFVNIGRMFLGKKDSYDSECFSLVRNSAFIMVALVIQRWILFGFTVGKGSEDEAYYFFRYFVEGLECAVACPLLFFLEKWGGQIFVKSPRSPKAAGGKIARRRQVPEEIVVGSQSRPISTIESVYAARVTRRMETETRDVVYSSVLPSERLQKMFDMYKRMNVLPVDVTVVAGEEFYECRDDAATVYEDVILKESPTEIEVPATKISRAPEHVKKRNALYASKYLVLNSKETKAPSFLGAPCKSSATDNATVSPGVNKTDEIVAKWLSDNSKNLGTIEKRTESREPKEAPPPEPHPFATTNKEIVEFWQVKTKIDGRKREGTQQPRQPVEHCKIRSATPSKKGNSDGRKQKLLVA
ncbi:hypothetical protein RUM44_004678 [Polyplax serrata]|uniref:Uncharacterized protein n=1 Tax=Polyplax serrata TaxID=468196 RepID=A0ABR1B3K7_POLSC